MTAGTRLVDRYKFVNGFGPALPSTSSTNYVDLDDYNHATVLINAENATTVTGSAITLTQAQDVSGTGAKALAFSVYFYNLDTVASDTLVQGAASGNTFTTSAVNSKSAQYFIEINAADLDINNGFSTVKVNLGTGVATVIGVDFIMSGARYGGNFAQFPSAIV
jgi:hypothetical protein